MGVTGTRPDVIRPVRPDDVAARPGPVTTTLAELELPHAPPVVRAAPSRPVRRRWPALALLVLAAVLTLAPVAGGLFAKVAAGKQLVDRFAPYLTADSLARYDTDVATIRTATAALDDIYADQRIPAERFPGVDEFRARSATIDARAGSLLRAVASTRSDYEAVADIGGFDRVPFLLVIAGVVAGYAGTVLRYGPRRRAGPTALLAVLLATMLVAYPFVSGFDRGAAAGERMLGTLSPVMTSSQVRQLQGDFIVLVTAVGELDTAFREVPSTGPAAGGVRALVSQWPTVSADLASLVGAINDNIGNYDELAGLDAATSALGVSGLRAFPWLLVGIGASIAALSLAALPRRRKAMS